MNQEEHQQLNIEIANLIRRITDEVYFPSRFDQMVREMGAFDAICAVLSPGHVTEGFSRLWEAGRQDLTIEQYILQSQFSNHFPEPVLVEARKRLS
jgi:hypothetical protein